MNGVSEYGTLFIRYLDGDYYPSGWKSPWRIKLESDRAEEEAKRRILVKQKREAA